MDENELTNQNQELNLPEVTEADLKEAEGEISANDIAELEADFANLAKQEIKWRHPQQVLTNKEMQILMSKKEEDLTESERTALKWMILRLKHHNSSPRLTPNKRQNALKRKKRRMSKVSRKANR
jgi:hypothetical protein